MRKTPYETLINRRRTWTPVKTTKGELKDGAEDTIRRALAARHMELPVGAFVQEALETVSYTHLTLPTILLV